MAKSNFIVRGGADFSGIKRELVETQKQLDNFKNGVSKTMKTIGTILGSLAVGKLVKDSTRMAIGVETAVENINHNMGQAAGAFQDWIETQSKSLGMAKADAYNYGSIFSNLLSSFTSSAQEIADKTQELMKAAAIISSRTGRSYDDVANRIRSGMLGSTEAIEDLGVYTNISMIESTEAFRKFAGDKSWAQLDFQTQQQIRLAAILEQTYKRYGDTLADNTQLRQAQFIASLKNIQLSLGQAFLPVYNAVLPALTAMADAIGRVVNLIAQFTTALFGAPKTIQNQTKAIKSQVGGMQDLAKATTGAGKAAKKAAKDAKGALAPFDEINQLPTKTGASSGAGEAGVVGGGGGAAIEMPTMDTGGFASSIVEVSDKVKQFADKVKTTFSKVRDFIAKNKTAIISALAGIGAAIATYLIGANWGTIVTVVKAAMTKIGTAIAGISLPILAVAALIGLIVAAVVDLWQTNEEFRNKVIKAWNGIKDTLKNIWNTVLKPIWAAFIDMLLDVWNKGIRPLWNKWKDFIKAVVYLMTDLWNGMKPVVDWIIKVFGPVIVEVFKATFKTISNTVNAMLEVLGYMLDGASKVIKGISEIFSGLITFLKGVFTGSWGTVFDGLGQIFKGFWGVIEGVLNVIISGFLTLINWLNSTFFSFWKLQWIDAEKAFNRFKTGVSNIWNSVRSSTSSAWNQIKNSTTNALNSIGTSITNKWNSIKTTLGSLNSYISGTFKKGWSTAWNSIKTIFSNVFNSLKGIVKAPLNFVIDAVNKVIRGINRFKINIPSWVASLAGVRGGSIGFNIPTIPRLAKGGYVGANNPMLAIVGDNRMEGEIIAPESKIYEQTLRAIRDAGSSDRPIELVIQLGSLKVFHEIINGINDAQRQAGKTLIRV